MRKITILLLTLLLVNCSSNDVELDEISTCDNFTNEVITPGEAETITMDFLNDLCNSTRSTNSKEIESVYAWRFSELYPDESKRSGTATNNQDTILYIVNFQNSEGYTLVSAKKESPCVVAYIEEGTLTPNDEIDNPGFKLFLNGLRDWELPEPGHEPIQLWANISPMLSTRWGQRAPYNMFCFTDSGQQAVAGCVAIAVAQIVAYHHSPSEYNGHVYDWNAILQSDTVSVTDTIAANSVGHLVRDIGGLVGTTYGVGQSGAYSSHVYFCLGMFDYNYIQTNGLNRERILNSLLNNRPLYISGYYYENGYPIGHAWVIDGSHYGYVEIPGSTPYNSSTQTYFLAHCNWGWKGKDNGYYVLGAFERKFVTFTTYEDGHYPFNTGIVTYTNVYPIP